MNKNKIKEILESHKLDFNPFNVDKILDNCKKDIDGAEEIKKELNENLKKGMGRKGAYSIYNKKAIEYLNEHPHIPEFLFLYPEEIIYF